MNHLAIDLSGGNPLSAIDWSIKNTAGDAFHLMRELVDAAKPRASTQIKMLTRSAKIEVGKGN